MQAPAITSNVSGLAQAIGSYGSTASAPDSAPAKLDLTSTGSGNLVAAAMADALKQFDANGKPLGAPAGLSSDAETLRLKALQTQHAAGFLAVPK